MAILTIKEKDYEAKCNFKFDKLADEKYSEEDKNGNKSGGFHTIYTGLLQYSNKHLVYFWDCALAYLGKAKPSLADIEEALETRIEADGDTEYLFKEAFKTVDESGFFKRQAKNFWRNMENFKKTGKTEEEQKQNEQGINMLIQARDELKA